MMKKQSFLFSLVSLTIYLTVGALQSAGAATHPLGKSRTQICGVCEGWTAKRYSDQYPNRRYARRVMANLNVGEPRTVRLIYFLPNDRPYRADVVQRMKDEIVNVQTFFAEQMEAHGYGRRTFRVEIDAQGEPMVHRVDGRHPDSHYLDDTSRAVNDEVLEAFDFDANVYLIVIDHSIGGIGLGDGRVAGGVGSRWAKNGGGALVPTNFSFHIVAHELGHAWGLLHDFRDNAYIMSYGFRGPFRLSACHAEFLSVHPYFNLNISTEGAPPPIIELISSPRYRAAAKSVSVQLKVNDSDGVHQVFLHAAQPDDRIVKACRSLGGKQETVIDFDYDGVIPSFDIVYTASTSLLNPILHPIHVEAIDTDGNVSNADFVLFSEVLQPLTKISGDNQTGLPNTSLPVPFVVEVRDLHNGFPREGVAVSFTVTAGDGSLSVEHTTTDGQGRAESTLTLGPNHEVNIVEVSAGGIQQRTSFTAVAGDSVAIPDPHLRVIIETKLGKRSGEPIAPAEMMTLFGLDAPNANISDLTGLQTATNLVFLDLGTEYIEAERRTINSNSIEDLSPLMGLVHLKSLILNDNNISDISVVTGFAELGFIHLGNNNIPDIPVLSGLTYLRQLFLDNNNISDISALSGLNHSVHLKSLILNDNNISDISVVAGLANLTWLDLGGNQITDISAVAGLANLRNLNLADNNITDLSPLVANTGLGVGDWVDVRGNPLSYLSIYTHIPTLQGRGVKVESDADGTRPPDVNGDGSVDVLDLIAVTSYFGDTGENIATDVSGDGVVDALDLVLVAGSFDGTAAAPSTQPQIPEALTAVEVRQWLTDARSLEMKDPIIKRGIVVLEQLLVSLIPKETELLANYPNPFNPETWIPYRLAEDAFVSLTIYDLSGRVVRSLDVGHQIASVYESRSKAVYWDGRNNFGETVASGVYFYQFVAENLTDTFSAMRKMVILK